MKKLEREWGITNKTCLTGENSTNRSSGHFPAQFQPTGVRNEESEVEFRIRISNQRDKSGKLTNPMGVKPVKALPEE